MLKNLSKKYHLRNSISVRIFRLTLQVSYEGIFVFSYMCVAWAIVYMHVPVGIEFQW